MDESCACIQCSSKGEITCVLFCDIKQLKDSVGKKFVEFLHPSSRYAFFTFWKDSIAFGISTADKIRFFQDTPSPEYALCGIQTQDAVYVFLMKNKGTAFSLLSSFQSAREKIPHPSLCAQELPLPAPSTGDAEKFLFQIMKLNNEMAQMQRELTQKNRELQNAYETIKAQSQKDSLTNISCRKHFMTRAEEEIHRANRYGSPLSLMFLDLDNFKTINDIYGHKAGDSTLQLFTENCTKELRQNDLFGRIGGEEFAILLVEADSDGALSVAERIRKRIAQLCVPTEEACNHFISVSIGLVTLQKGETLASALHRSDMALYQAKHNGRNRIERDLT